MLFKKTGRTGSHKICYSNLRFKFIITSLLLLVGCGNILQIFYKDIDDKFGIHKKGIPEPFL